MSVMAVVEAAAVAQRHIGTRLIALGQAWIEPLVLLQHLMAGLAEQSQFRRSPTQAMSLQALSALVGPLQPLAAAWQALELLNLLLEALNLTGEHSTCGGQFRCLGQVALGLQHNYSNFPNITAKSLEEALN